MSASAMHAVCPVHGRVSAAGQVAIEGGAAATFIDCAVSCPICGRAARIPSGTYDRVSSVFEILRAPSVTTGQVRQLRQVLEAAPAHPVADTVAAAKSINAAFAALFTDEASNRVFTTILALLALFFSFYEAATDSSGQEAAETRRQMHDDAASMRETLDRHAELLGQIRDALDREPPRSLATPPAPPTSQPGHARTVLRATASNRHERRARKARARRTPRDRHPSR